MVVGWLAERGFDRQVATALVAFVIGEIVMFGLGLAWLSTIVGAKAIELGLLPFLPGEALKVGLAVALMPLVWRKVGTGE
jgi:biotin transport system substrate-specific component